MKLLSVAGKKAQEVAKAAVAAVERAVSPAEEEPPAPYDPWLRNERPREVEGRASWLQQRRRGGWLGW